MQLEARGDPLHTRSLTVTLTHRADGRLDVRAGILDLRKRGFVPVAGELQPAGVVHDMHLGGIIDPVTATLAELAAEQRSVAFEPSAVTQGESCRDPIDRLCALAGTRLDAGFTRRLSAAFGGPRGCSHLLTLAYLLGASAAWALERLPAVLGPAPGWRPGERVFRRDLVIDGHEPAPGRVQLVAQLTELVYRPAPAVAQPMTRFGAEVEVRALATLDYPGFAVETAEMAERRRLASEVTTAAWRPRPDVAAALAGLRLAAGATGTLFARLGDRPEDRPHLDLALQLAPTLVQCAAAISEPWAGAFQAHPSVVAMGGLPDSCYMWRREGALGQAREREGGADLIRPLRS